MNNYNSDLKKVIIPSHLEWFYQQGFSIIPLKPQSDTKKPLLDKWKKYQEKKPTRDEIVEWCKQTNRFAIVCGEVSDNLVVIDIDKEELFAGLNLGVVVANTYTEERAGKFHIFLRTTRPIKHKQLQFDGHEEISIRFNGNLVIAGGTSHPSGGIYQHFLTSPREIKTIEPGFFDDLERLWRDYRGLTTKSKKGFSIHKRTITPKTTLIQLIKECCELKELTDRGDYYTCRCPFPDHRDLTPSFTIYKKTNTYFCFGCGRGGNVVTFVTDNYGISTKEAVRRLTAEGKIEEVEEETEEKKKLPLIDKIIQLVLDNCKLIHDQYKDGFAVTNSGGNKKVTKLHSRKFKFLVGKLLWDQEEKGISSDALTSALNTLEGKALYDGEEVYLHNRVASHEGKLYYDMCDEAGRIVEIDSEGWRFTKESPVLFRREQHQKAQVEPTRGGDLNKLWKYLNLSSEEDGVLFRSCLTSFFFSDIDHPIPVLYGDQGSGKTSSSECSKVLIDPSSLGTSALSKDEESLILTLEHNWLSVFDNVTEVKDWQSDILSRAITGGGQSRRRRYTDDEEQLSDFRRSILINGLTVPLTSPDVMDRSLLFKLKRFDQHGSKGKLEKEFKKEKAEIFGGLLDLVSRTLKIIKEQEIKTSPGIRLYDFGVIGEAAARAAGEDNGKFMELFLRKKADDNFEVIECSLMGSVLCALIADGAYTRDNSSNSFLNKENNWSGSSTELLKTFEFKAEELKIDRRTKEWKGSPRGLSVVLDKLQTNFKAIGVEFEKGKQHEGRYINILVKESCPLLKGKISSQPSLASPEDNSDEKDESDEKKQYKDDDFVKEKENNEKTSYGEQKRDNTEVHGSNGGNAGAGEKNYRQLEGLKENDKKAFDDDFQAQQALEAKERLEAEGLKIDQDSSNEEQSEDRKPVKSKKLSDHTGTETIELA